VHEEYIEELLSKDAADLDFDDLKVLSHLHAEFMPVTQ
jgi:hypothetical protein